MHVQTVSILHHKHTCSDELEALEAPVTVSMEGNGDEVFVRHEVHPGGRKLVPAEPEEEIEAAACEETRRVKQEKDI